MTSQINSNGLPVFCSDIALMVAHYATETKYKVIDCIFNEFQSNLKLWRNLSKNPNVDKILHLFQENQRYFIGDRETMRNLCRNPSAIDYVVNLKNFIEWDHLCENTNPKAIELLKQNQDEIDWEIIEDNPSAIEILKNNVDKYDYPIEIDFLALCPTINDVEMIKKNLDNINLHKLCNNPKNSKILMKVINDDNVNKFFWYSICKYPENMRLIQRYHNKINWTGLSYNTNRNAIKLCIKNSDKIDMNIFCKNPEPLAISFIKKNKDELSNTSRRFIFDNTNPEIISVLKYIIDTTPNAFVRLREEILSSPHYIELLKYLKIDIDTLDYDSLNLLLKNDDIIIVDRYQTLSEKINIYDTLVNL